MKPVLAILAAALTVVAATSFAADTVAVADMKPPAKWAPNKRTMERDGRFHYLHVKKQKMDCGDCHADEAKDPLFLRSTEAPPRPLAAHVNRGECVDCHQGDKKPLWYGAKPR